MALQTPINGKTTDPEHRTWAWGFLGSVIAPIAVAVGPIGISLGAAAGMLIGNITGRAKRAKELETGMKTVRKPTYINGGMAKGIMWGNVVGTLAGLAVGAAILALTGGTAAVVAGAGFLFAGAAAPATMGIASLGIAATWLITNAGMAFKGSVERHAEMKMDYKHAVEYEEARLNKTQAERIAKKEVTRHEREHGDRSQHQSHAYSHPHHKASPNQPAHDFSNTENHPADKRDTNDKWADQPNINPSRQSQRGEAASMQP